MKATGLILTIAVLAGCARTNAPDATEKAATTAPGSTSAAAPATPITASATGIVESIDIAAKTVTIAHGPIAAVNWPAMTMTFDASAVDLSSIKAGDHVDFELAVNGMHGTVVKITRS